MATWTDVADANQLPGEPIKSVDIIAIKDNVTALAEGAAGAPKINGTTSAAVQTGGIENLAVTNPKIANNAVTNGKVADGALGSEKFQTSATEDAWVRDRIAASFHGVVGTYAMLKYTGGGTVSPGNTVAGTSLEYAAAGGASVATPTVNGTWRCMGYVDTGTANAGDEVSLFVRIS